ncbi:MAG: hypothetical protein B6I20_13045 [Bacteroidetes bacterium 4572_117]|nr:MAG: hypothetical protein B6I20_13045 [Bacteroidetes bacterium 4572_117]
MDLQSRKIAFVQEFLKIQNEDLVAYLEKTLDESKKIFIKSNLQPMSIEEFNNRIDQSMKNSQDEKLTEMNILFEEIQKWS